ncbi:acyl-CoA dehydrogenase family protein [Myxococcota bacterium]|nr:acyl-CoA dehydrogenase family protein [Myxococcota bacterium]
MPSFYDDNDDLRWYVDHGIDWEPIVRLTEYDWKAPDGFRSVDEARDFYREVMGLLGTVCAEQIAPRWKELDHSHPHVVDGQVVESAAVTEIFSQLAELGIHGMCLPRELGGMNAPLLVLQLNTEMLARADVSVCAHAGFHGGMALAALMYSVLEGTTTFQQDPPSITATRFRECIDEICSGAAWGSMDITEPDAGSDMAALKTRGVLGADGQWRVTGQKIFITSGHGRWHFVIARTEETDARAGGAAPSGADAFAGLKGLSMFLVPAWDYDEAGNKVMRASFVGVEEKLGHNASATVTISFEDSPAHLIGQRGEGFKYMLLLMNNARVAVGFESLGVAEAAWRAAKQYAAVRPSMGKTIDQHEMIADILDEMQTHIQGIRALGIQAAWHEELNQKLRLALAHFDLPAERRAQLEREQKRHARKSRHLTPLLKWISSEQAVHIARQSVQVHGGSGYIKETGVEKLLRDAMVFPIYEGTSQIQALMVMKDNLLDAVRNPKGFVRRTAQARWRSVSAKDGLEKRVAHLRLESQQAIQFLVSRLAATKLRELRHHRPGDWTELMKDWDPKKDFALAMLHAERLTSMLADAAVAEILWEQGQKDGARRELLVRWLERAEPRSRHMHDLITTTGPRLLSVLAGDTSSHAAAK